MFQRLLLAVTSVLLTASPCVGEAGKPTAPATRPIVQADGRFKFWFKDAAAVDVLDYYAAASGNAVVFTGDINARMSILVTEPITSEMALKCIQSGLKAQGYYAELRGKMVLIQTRDRVKKLS